ncbi:MAG: hypothetical protein RL199_565 [Pseudomonadota bacterium]|jgi:MYXO-CTERM domain-containing protein
MFRQALRSLLAFWPAAALAASSRAEVPSSSGLRWVVEVTSPAAARDIAATVSRHRGLTVERRFRHLPFVVVRGAEGPLQEVSALAGVVRVHPEERFEPLGRMSPLDQIRQPEALTMGADGVGSTVVILDSGVDYRHPAFGACDHAGAAGCRVVYAADIGSDDGRLDDAERHGTNVAGIVAATAPGASIAVLDVFDADGTAPLSNLLEAFDWAIGQRDKYGIVAINMSVGGWGWRTSDDCAGDGLAAAVRAAAEAGIASVAAAGNDGATNGVRSPACIPEVVSVGATVTDDAVGRPDECGAEMSGLGQVACFSNVGRPLTLLAPGAPVTAAGVTMSGTSQATPHVSAAVAILASRFPDESVARRVARLTSSGRPVFDPRVSHAFPLLDVAAALEAPVDTSGPTAALEVGHGGWFSTSFIDLNFHAQDPSGIRWFCVEEGGECPWRLYGEPSWWRPATASDRVAVKAWLTDNVGNVSGPFEASGRLDADRPSDGALAGELQGSDVLLSWPPSQDASSGVAGYVVVEDPSNSATYCAGGTPLGEVTEAARFVVRAPLSGRSHRYRVCAFDRVGYRSTGMSVELFVPGDGKQDGPGTGSDASDGHFGCTSAGAAGLLSFVGLLGRRRRRFT